jgi:RNA polymerase sigma-70 factor, ECF subfamily
VVSIVGMETVMTPQRTNRDAVAISLSDPLAIRGATRLSFVAGRTVADEIGRGADPVNASGDLIAASTPDGRRAGVDSGPVLRPLDPKVLPDHLDALYRAAWALCGSRHEAEDLVQDTFARVLKRPRLLRSDNTVGYLLRALRNTNAARHRAARRRPTTVPLVETAFEDRAESDGAFDARELMEAIATTPRPYRDAVVAVDVVGMSYRQAARHLRTPEVTITSRLSRGRQHIARALGDPTGGHRGRRPTNADPVHPPGVESSRGR